MKAINIKALIWKEDGFIIDAGKPEVEGGYDEWFVQKGAVKAGEVWFCKWCEDNFWKSEKEVIEMILDQGYAEEDEQALLENRLKELGGK